MVVSNGLHISRVDPASRGARAMGAALWAEIQHRYGFTAKDPFDPAAFDGPVGGFWLASDGRVPVGCVALSPLEGDVAELDVMYVAPDYRRSGLAQRLLAELEAHALSVGVRAARLRAGEPQPEALAFYSAAGFVPIAPFGRWIGDDTARCFEKRLVRSGAAR